MSVFTNSDVEFVNRVRNQYDWRLTNMIRGYMGIEYSTDEIKGGRFVDESLEQDYLQARYSLLRGYEKMPKPTEDMWRKNGVDARKAYVKMLESTNQGMSPFYDDKENEPDVESDIFTYHTGDEVPTSVKTVIISSDVDEISECAFRNCISLKSIVIPESVTKIGKQAFANCIELVDVRLVNVDFIGDMAFLNCTNLNSATLGSSVQHIGMGAFKNCTNLHEATIPPNVTFIGDYAFADCPSLEVATVYDGVSKIPSYCFQNDASLKTVVIPSSVYEVCEHAFENCPNAQVLVPTMNMQEAEELLGVKMVAKSEDDDTIFKCDKGFIVKLYKDLF